MQSVGYVHTYTHMFKTIRRSMSNTEHRRSRLLKAEPLIHAMPYGGDSPHLTLSGGASGARMPVAHSHTSEVMNPAVTEALARAGLTARCKETSACMRDGGSHVSVDG